VASVGVITLSDALQMPKEMCFLPSYGFICENLEFPPVKSSKIFTAHRILRNTIFEGKKSRVFRLLQIYVFYRCENTGHIDFPEKRAPTKVTHFLPVSRNFTEGNPGKFTVSFAFCAHVDVIKYRKTLTFSIERAQIT